MRFMYSNRLQPEITTRPDAGGGGWLRAAACLLAVALALSLTPGTVVAQDNTPPSVSGLIRSAGVRNGILVSFNEPLTVGSFNIGSLSVTVDGVPRAVNYAILAGDKTAASIVVASPIPGFARVVLTYDKTANPNPLADAAGNQLASFTRVVTIELGEGDVYDALGAYFSGSAPLSAVENILRAVNDESYHERLREEAAAGSLNERFGPLERTKWGTDESLGWRQVGFPGVSDPSLTCGGEGQPPLTGDDHGEFFWACTEDNRWVPVRLAREGTDYAADEDLVRPGQNGYNPECLYRDSEGNPTPAFRPQIDPNTGGVLYVNGQVQGTKIHGSNWDPIAKICTTRGI